MHRMGMKLYAPFGEPRPLSQGFLSLNNRKAFRNPIMRVHFQLRDLLTALY